MTPWRHVATSRLTLGMTSQRDAIASWGNPRALRLLSLESQTQQTLKRHRDHCSVANASRDVINVQHDVIAWRQGVMGWSYSIGNTLVAFLDLKNPKNDTEIIVLSQILPEMSWTSSMTSQHDVIASWVGRVSGHHPFSHSTHFYEHFDILYNIASQNFPRKIIF